MSSLKPDITLPAAFGQTPTEKACAGIRMDLAACLLQSNCVLRDNHTPKECLEKYGDTIPLECQYLRKSLATCKRGMVSACSSFGLSWSLRRTDTLGRPSSSTTITNQLDMRKRFRGNPSTTNNRKEGVPDISVIGVNAHPSQQQKQEQQPKAP